MKKLMALTMFFLLLATGCTKEPINNDVEGFWELEEYTTREDGTQHRCERIYYSITREVIEVAEKQGPHGYGAFIGRFGYEEGNTVRMREFYQRKSTSDNGIKATVEELVPFGIHALDTRFKILKANGKQLVLQSDYATLTLNRF